MVLKRSVEQIVLDSKSCQVRWALERDVTMAYQQKSVILICTVIVLNVVCAGKAAELASQLRNRGDCVMRELLQVADQ